MGNYVSDKKNSRHFSLKLARNTDTEVIDKLESVTSVQGYLKKLVQADIAANGAASREFARRFISFEGAEYQLVCILQQKRGVDCFEFYIAPAGGGYSLKSMFAIPTESVNGDIDKALDLGEPSAPEYLSIFLSAEWV